MTTAIVLTTIIMTTTKMMMMVILLLHPLLVKKILFIYYNTPANNVIIIDMHGIRFTIDDNANVIPDDVVDEAKPMTIQAARRQLNAIINGCITARSIKVYRSSQ